MMNGTSLTPRPIAGSGAGGVGQDYGGGDWCQDGTGIWRW